MRADAVSAAVLASGLVAPVSAKAFAVNGFRRWSKTAHNLRELATDCCFRTRVILAAAPLGLLIVAAKKTHELAFGENFGQRCLGHLQRSCAFVITILNEALSLTACLRSQAPHDARCAKQVAAAEKMQRIAAAVADFPHQALVIVKYFGFRGSLWRRATASTCSGPFS